MKQANSQEASPLRRRQVFLTVARYVQNGMPEPIQMSFSPGDPAGVHLCFDTRAAALLWAERLNLKPGSQGTPADDGKRLIFTWWAFDEYGWYWGVDTYPLANEGVPADPVKALSA